MTQVSFLREDGEAVVTVVVPGDPKSPYIARDDHPNFKSIIAAAVSGDTDELPFLFDVAETVAHKFQRLSERVTVDNGEIKFDGVAIDSTLSQQILDVIAEGGTEASYKGLVAFMEKVYTNPDGPTATRIFDWFKAQDGMTITDEGNIVGYKYVNTDDEYGYRSVASGKEPVTVRFADGTEQVFTGRVPNPVGATVEMPRDLVNNNAEQTCSVGLHVGAWAYSGGHYTRNTLEVHVNPRDIVSVPVDYDGQKVRVCRYTVVGPVTEKYGQAVKTSADDAPRERGTADAPTTREDLDLALAPLRRLTVGEFAEGDRVVDQFGRRGFLVKEEDGNLRFLRDGSTVSSSPILPSGDSEGGLYHVSKVKLEVGDLVRIVKCEPWMEGFDATVGTIFRVISADSIYVYGLGDRETGEWKLYVDFDKVERVEESDGGWQDGDRFVDEEGDYGTIQNGVGVYDDDKFPGDMTEEDLESVGAIKVESDSAGSIESARKHGKGGPTSQAAKGNGKNPAQDALGRFSSGRPGSQRNAKGQFCG
jgi:hypothetical protein